ncbi:MAG: hypothetical protein G3I10_04375 [Ferrovum sp.]|nr:hypothetical protein [Ferrovum sp.]
MAIYPPRGASHGVRNTVGMAFHPVTHELWFTHLARDWLSDDLPNDTLNRPTPNSVWGIHAQSIVTTSSLPITAPGTVPRKPALT